MGALGAAVEGVVVDRVVVDDIVVDDTCREEIWEKTVRGRIFTGWSKMILLSRMVSDLCSFKLVDYLNIGLVQLGREWVSIWFRVVAILLRSQEAGSYGDGFL